MEDTRGQECRKRIFAIQIALRFLVG